MIRLPVDSLKEGQILAQDVMRGDGVVLLKQGHEVTNEVLSLLRRLDVESVVVEGDLFESEEARQEFFRRQEEGLDQRFSRVTDDQVLMGIRELFRQRLRQGLPLAPLPAPETEPDGSQEG